MAVIEPCFDVLCHMEVPSNCVPVFSGSPSLPNQHSVRYFRGVKFIARR